MPAGRHFLPAGSVNAPTGPHASAGGGRREQGGPVERASADAAAGSRSGCCVVADGVGGGRTPRLLYKEHLTNFVNHHVESHP